MWWWVMRDAATVLSTQSRNRMSPQSENRVTFQPKVQEIDIKIDKDTKRTDSSASEGSSISTPSSEMMQSIAATHRFMEMPARRTCTTHHAPRTHTDAHGRTHRSRDSVGALEREREREREREEGRERDRECVRERKREREFQHLPINSRTHTRQATAGLKEPPT